MHFGSSRRAAAGLVLALSVSAGPLAHAQGITTGTISGTVTDPSGAIVPNAQVVATKPDTQTQYKVTTDAQGSFSISNAAVGSYNIVVTSAGFSALTLKNVLVDANKVTDLGYPPAPRTRP